MNPGVQLMWTLKPKSTLKGVAIMVTAPAVVRQEQVTDFLFKDFIDFFFSLTFFNVFQTATLVVGNLIRKRINVEHG